MARKLTHLALDRIDLVDKGANPGAKVALFKRAPVEETKNMADTYTCPHCDKSFDSKDAMKAHMAADHPDAATAKRLADTQADLAAMKKRAEDAEAKLPKPEEDEVVKAAIDPVVKAAIAKAQKEAEDAKKEAALAREEVAKATEDRERAEFVAKADKLPSFGRAREFGPILHKISKVLDPAEWKFFWSRLNSADHVLRVSKAFTELGISSTEEGEPQERLTAMAQDLVKQSVAKGGDAKMTFEQAYNEVLKSPEGRDLYATMNRSK